MELVRVSAESPTKLENWRALLASLVGLLAARAGAGLGAFLLFALLFFWLFWLFWLRVTLASSSRPSSCPEIMFSMMGTTSSAFAWRSWKTSLRVMGAASTSMLLTTSRMVARLSGCVTTMS